MLGITIFVRHHAKGVTLTPAGQRLITEARLLLKHAAEFSKTAESLVDNARGEITIGCFPTLAARFMPSLMLEFSERYPQITLRLEEGDQEQLIRDLAQGRIELAFTYELGLPAGFDIKPLLTFSPVVALAADHRLAHSNDISLAEIAGEPFIMYDAPHFREYYEAIFNSLNLTPNIALRLRSFELIRGLVARGHGYAMHTVVPLTRTTYDGGQVVVKPLRDKVQAAHVVCVTPGSHLVRPAVGIFAEFMQSSLRRESYFNDDKALSTASAA